MVGLFHCHGYNTGPTLTGHFLPVGMWNVFVTSSLWSTRQTSHCLPLSVAAAARRAGRNPIVQAPTSSCDPPTPPCPPMPPPTPHTIHPTSVPCALLSVGKELGHTPSPTPTPFLFFFSSTKCYQRTHAERRHSPVTCPVVWQSGGLKEHLLLNKTV